MAKNRTKKVFMVLNIVVLLGLTGVAGYLFVENRDLNDQLTLTSEEKNRRLVEEVNKVFDLPDEDPVVAIVTNPEEFKSEYPAFDNVQEGDYLLFFRKARLNVLYRQSEGRVVKTASVFVPISVEIIGSDGATKTTETKLKDFGNQVTLIKTTKDGVTQSFVYDIGGDQQADAQKIAEQLGLEIGTTLPSSIAPSNDSEIIVVISDSEEKVQSSEDTGDIEEP